ncbi:MAG: hypothetical protein R2836_03370 [Chitinophagales bacterium]
MAKLKTTFACQSYKTTYAKWQGKCNACGEWNTIVEEVLEKPNKNEIANWRETDKQIAIKPKKLKDVEITETYKIDTGDSELNRVLGIGDNSSKR